MPKLIIQKGAKAGQQFELYQDIINIGRASSNNIIIDDPQASRNHAQIRREGNVYIIYDSSTNGTFVNGHRIEQKFYLQEGDQITIGNTVFSFGEGVGQRVGPSIPPLRPSPAQPVQPRAQQPSRDAVKYVDMTKSYVGSAVLTLLLYFIFYLPGLIVNIVYMADANRYKKVSGVTPSGYGCLIALIIVYFAIPVALAIIGGIVITVIGVSISSLLPSFFQ